MNELRAALNRYLAECYGHEAAVLLELSRARWEIAQAIAQINIADADARADSLSETLYAANQLRRARLATTERGIG